MTDIDSQRVFNFRSRRARIFEIFETWLSSGREHDLVQRDAILDVLRSFADDLCTVYDEEKNVRMVKKCFETINRQNARSVLTNAMKEAVADYITPQNRQIMLACIELYALQLTSTRLEELERSLNHGAINSLRRGIIFKMEIQRVLYRLLDTWIPVSSHWFDLPASAAFKKDTGVQDFVGLPSASAYVVLAIGAIIVVWLVTAAPTTR